MIMDGDLIIGYRGGYDEQHMLQHDNDGDVYIHIVCAVAVANGLSIHPTQYAIIEL